MTVARHSDQHCDDLVVFFVKCFGRSFFDVFAANSKLNPDLSFTSFRFGV